MCPEKQSKPVQVEVVSLSWALSSPLTLSHLESGHSIPFPPQDFCSPCVFVYCSHNTRSCGPGSASSSHVLLYNYVSLSQCCSLYSPQKLISQTWIINFNKHCSNRFKEKMRRKHNEFSWSSVFLIINLFKKYFIYLFLERREGKEKEREWTSMCGCLSCARYWGPGSQPTSVPWLGINPFVYRPAFNPHY